MGGEGWPGVLNTRPLDKQNDLLHTTKVLCNTKQTREESYHE